MGDTSDAIIVYSTVPDRDTGERIAGQLLEYRLAACVSLIPGVISHYRWRGKVEHANEVLMMIKARARDYPRLESALRSQHPYELPEIIMVPVSGGLAEYLHWIDTHNDEAS